VAGVDPSTPATLLPERRLSAVSEQRVPLYDAPVVAHVVRSGFVESVHHGSVVALDANGAALFSIGDVTGPIFPRSCSKPIQALAMLRAGLDLDGELLALASGSHSGESFHLEGVRRILAGSGLSEQDLQNTPDLPYEEQERDAWIASGRAASSVGQNCSGKHSAMLATCVAAGWDTATYLEVTHPLQRLIAQTLAELSGEPAAAVGVDGCGAPVMAVSLTGLARAFSRFASAPEGTEEARVAAATAAKGAVVRVMAQRPNGPRAQGKPHAGPARRWPPPPASPLAPPAGLG